MAKKCYGPKCRVSHIRWEQCCRQWSKHSKFGAQRPASLDDEAEEHTPVASFQHPAAAHPNQVYKNTSHIHYTHLQKRSNWCVKQNQTKSHQIRNVLINSEKPELFKEASRPSQISPRSLNGTDHFGQTLNNSTGNSNLLNTILHRLLDIERQEHLPAADTTQAYQQVYDDDI